MRELAEAYNDPTTDGLPKIQSFNEMCVSGDRQQKASEALVYVENGVLYVRGPYDYPIELSRIRTHTHLLSWVYHLLEKTWVTTHHVARLIEVVAELRNIDLHTSA